jgi:hypothetical protein
LEQRKGRIQRIGQQSDTIHVYMRYRDSVEDRVHELLSERIQDLHTMFGLIPDTIEDAWKKVAINRIEEARQKIDSVPKSMRYEQIDPVDWESCTDVLEDRARRERLSEGW